MRGGAQRPAVQRDSEAEDVKGSCSLPRPYIEVSDASSAPVVWVVVLFRCETCSATCPRKTKTIMQSTISCQLLVPCSRWGVARHVENLRESGETWHQQIPIAGGLTTRCRSRGPPGGGWGGGGAARDPRPYIEVIRVIRGLNSIFFVLWIAIVRDYAV